MNRATLHSPITLTGVGIHSGCACQVQLSPAPIGSGIVFFTPGSDGSIGEVQAHANYVVPQTRATRIEKNGYQVLTPEHLLAALFGLGVSDAIITLTSPEVPILDGSALPFTDAISATGVLKSDTPWAATTILKPIHRTEQGATVLALPDAGLRFSMIIEYDNFIGTQSVTWEYNQPSFSQDVAPARTYGFKSEIDQLIAAGLGKGGTLDNAVVIGDSNYLSTLRFPDELVRHKLLDLIGDLSLTGSFLQGHSIGIRSGHSLNRLMAEALSQL